MKIFKQKRLRRVLSLAFAFTLVFTLAMSASASTSFFRDGSNGLQLAECYAHLSTRLDGYINEVETEVFFYLEPDAFDADVEEETFAVTAYVTPYAPNNQPLTTQSHYEEGIEICVLEGGSWIQFDYFEHLFSFPSDMDVAAVMIQFSILNEYRDDYIYVLPMMIECTEAW